YVGGGFLTAGGVSAKCVARWDGTGWYALGSGMNNGVNNPVRAIGISGSNVYVGGEFTAAGGGGVNANHIARWDGNQWYPLGSGVSYGGEGSRGGLAIGSGGERVYGGGGLTAGGGLKGSDIRRWGGTQARSLRAGVKDGGGCLA